VKQFSIKLSEDSDGGEGLPESPEFPKYVSPLTNLANRFAQATRSNIVGQLSELVKQFQVESLDGSYEAWVKWYLERYPEAIDNATGRTWVMVNNFRETLAKMDENLVKDWVKDLVLVKTYIGLLKAQQAILKTIAEDKGTSSRLATPEEESRGIDGFVGDLPISIKPSSYKLEEMLVERIGANIVYYDKDEDVITFEYDF
jgi:hypothetical protein